jgi:hypothetical protein
MRAQIAERVRSEVAARSSSLISELPQYGLQILSVASNLIYVVIIPVLAFFFLKDAPTMRGHFLDLLEEGPRRALLDDVISDVNLLLAHYMRALFLLSAAAFATYAIFFSVMRMPYAILLAAYITISTQARRVLAIVVNGLIGLHHAGFAGDRGSGVGIAVEAREVAARNLGPDAMPLEKHVAGDAGVERDLVHLAGPHRFGLLERVAVAQPQNAVGQVARVAIGEHVHQLGGEIRVALAGGQT